MKLAIEMTLVLYLLALVTAQSFTQAATESQKIQAEPEPVKAPEKEKIPATFSALRSERATLLKEIPVLERQLEQLRFREQRLRFLLRDLDRAKAELARAKAEKPLNQRKVDAIEDSIKTTEAELAEAKEAAKQIKSKVEEVDAKDAKLEAVENKIDELLNPEIAKQNFKTQISIYFTLLVGAVILGFFGIAVTDPVVRQAIFSGQAGIQFLTLFSLVIAIILFGITGILEGKELSALLGGISGYILGKVT
jgi:hypothetical protein